MDEFRVDLVLCRHDTACDKKNYLFYAPAWSGLHKGDRVFCATIHGRREAVVENVITVRVDSDIFEFACAASGAYLPLKRVVAKIIVEEMKYTEEEENADD